MPASHGYDSNAACSSRASTAGSRPGQCLRRGQPDIGDGGDQGDQGVVPVPFAVRDLVPGHPDVPGLVLLQPPALPSSAWTCGRVTCRSTRYSAARNSAYS